MVTNIMYRCMRILDPLLISSFGVALVFCLITISLREDSLQGAILLFIFLASVATALTLSSRYSITTMLILLIVFEAADTTDNLKRKLVGQHLTLSDCFVVANMTFSGLKSLLAIYAPILIPWLYIGFVAISAVVIMLIYEIYSVRRWRVVKYPRYIAAFLWCFAFTNTIILFNSAYLQAIGSQNFYWAVANPGPMRVSYWVSNIRTYISLGTYAWVHAVPEVSGAHSVGFSVPRLS